MKRRLAQWACFIVCLCGTAWNAGYGALMVAREPTVESIAYHGLLFLSPFVSTIVVVALLASRPRPW